VTENGNGPLIFLIAGEPSGDFLGARLMEALKRETDGAIRFTGVGGSYMEAQGLNSLFDIREIAVMGWVEVIAHIPTVLRRIKDTEAAARATKPDLFLSIDSPSFSLEVSKRLRGEGYPLVHYVAPSVWAWKAGRARKIAAFLDHLLCLLPFEPPYFEVHGLDTTFIGHPAVERAGAAAGGDGLRQRLGLGLDSLLLSVLPGSRRGEVQRHAAIFGEALGLLAKTWPELTALVPTVANVAEQVGEAIARWPVPAKLLTQQDDKYAAFAASRAALAASGTVGIELAVAGLPAVMAYRLNLMSAAFVPLVVNLRYASIASLVLDRSVQPECLQFNCNPKKLASTLKPLIEEREERQRVIRDGFKAAEMLGMGGDPPSKRAANVLLSLLQKGS